jgi:hypothetical protein
MMSMRTRIIRAVATALAMSALDGAALAPRAGAQCGQDYRAAPAHSAVPGGPPLAIGDSVLADAVPELVQYGFEADGMVCRQMSQGLAILRQRGPTLPHLVVLALGANGEVTEQQIDTALVLLGPERVLVLVTPHGGVLPSTPNVIRSAATAHAGRILLLDWDRLAAEHPDWLAPDGVHLGGTAGIQGFAGMIAGVLPYAGPAEQEREREPEPEVSGSEPGTPKTLPPPPPHPHTAHHKPPRHRARPPARSSRSAAPPTPRAPAQPVADRAPPRRLADPAPARLASRGSDAISPALVAACAAAALALVGALVLRARRRRTR